VSYNGVTWYPAITTRLLDTSLNFKVPGDTSYVWVYIRNETNERAAADLGVRVDYPRESYSYPHLSYDLYVNGVPTSTIYLNPGQTQRLYVNVAFAFGAPMNYTMNDVIPAEIYVIMRGLLPEETPTPSPTPTAPPGDVSVAPDLPVTGADLALVAGAVALLALGSLFLIAKRRRREDDDTETTPTTSEVAP